MQKRKVDKFFLVVVFMLLFLGVAIFVSASLGKLIKDKESGFLIYKEDEWVTKLVYALNLTPSEMNNINNLAYARFYQLHHINFQAESLINFYKKVCNQNLKN